MTTTTRYRTHDNAAWCKGCDWERQGLGRGQAATALTAAARHHVRRTGHIVEVERITPLEVAPN